MRLKRRSGYARSHNSQNTLQIESNTFKSLTLLHEALVLQAYILCEVKPRCYVECLDTFHVSFGDKVSETTDMETTRLLLGMNWLSQALSKTDGSRTQILNISIAFVDLSQSLIFVDSGIFLELGRQISTALGRLDMDLDVKWKFQFYSLVGYAEILYSNDSINTFAMDSLNRASSLAPFCDNCTSFYMQILSRCVLYPAAFSNEWNEHPYFRLLIQLTVFENGSDQDWLKLFDQYISTRMLDAQAVPYIDLNFLKLGLLKQAIRKGYLVDGGVVLGDLISLEPFSLFDLRRKIFKEELSIKLQLHSHSDIRTLLPNYERYAKLISSMSYYNFNNAVLECAASFWNLLYPLLDGDNCKTNYLMDSVMLCVKKTGFQYGKTFPLLSQMNRFSEFKGNTKIYTLLQISKSLEDNDKAYIVYEEVMRSFEPNYTFKDASIRIKETFNPSKCIDLDSMVELLRQIEDRKARATNFFDLIHYVSLLILDVPDVSPATIMEVIQIELFCLLDFLPLSSSDDLCKSSLLDAVLSLCIRAQTTALKEQISWMVFNSVALIWQSYSKLYHQIMSSKWIVAIESIYEAFLTSLIRKTGYFGLITVMYAEIQLDSFTSEQKKLPANGKAVSANKELLGLFLKNAEEAFGRVVNLQNIELSTTLALIKSWKKFQVMKVTFSGSAPTALTFADPLISFYLELDKDLEGNEVDNAAEALYLDTKGFESMPILLKTQLYLKAAKHAVARDQNTIAIGLYRKVFGLLELSDFESPLEWKQRTRIGALVACVAILAKETNLFQKDIAMKCQYTLKCYYEGQNHLPDIFQSLIRLFWNVLSPNFGLKTAIRDILPHLTTFFNCLSDAYTQSRSFKEMFDGLASDLDHKIISDLGKVWIHLNSHLDIDERHVILKKCLELIKVEYHQSLLVEINGRSSNGAKPIYWQDMIHFEGLGYLGASKVIIEQRASPAEMLLFVQGWAAIDTEANECRQFAMTLLETDSPLSIFCNLSIDIIEMDRILSVNGRLAQQQVMIKKVDTLLRSIFTATNKNKVALRGEPVKAKKGQDNSVDLADAILPDIWNGFVWPSIVKNYMKCRNDLHNIIEQSLHTVGSLIAVLFFSIELKTDETTSKLLCFLDLIAETLFDPLSCLSVSLTLLNVYNPTSKDKVKGVLSNLFQFNISQALKAFSDSQPLFNDTYALRIFQKVADCLILLKEYSKAVVILNQIIVLSASSDMFEALASLSQCYFECSDHSSAIKMCDKVLKGASTGSQAYLKCFTIQTQVLHGMPLVKLETLMEVGQTKWTYCKIVLMDGWLSLIIKHGLDNEYAKECLTLQLQIAEALQLHHTWLDSLSHHFKAHFTHFPSDPPISEFLITLCDGVDFIAPIVLLARCLDLIQALIDVPVVNDVVAIYLRESDPAASNVNTLLASLRTVRAEISLCVVPSDLVDINSFCSGFAGYLDWKLSIPLLGEEPYKLLKGEVEEWRNDLQAFQSAGKYVTLNDIIHVALKS